MDASKLSQGRAFTLIELLVVIAITGILSSLSVVSIGSSRGKARTVSAKTAIITGGRAIEGCREEINGVISNVPGSGSDTLTGAGGTLSSVFTGTCSAADLTYPTRIDKLPSSRYTYTYRTLDAPVSGVREVLPSAGYLLYTDLPDAAGYFVSSTDGAGDSATNPGIVTVSVRHCAMAFGGGSRLVEFRQGGTLVASTYVTWNGTLGVVSVPPGTYDVQVLSTPTNSFYSSATPSIGRYVCSGLLGTVNGTSLPITISSTANVIGIVIPPF
jgi:prepilin-type N-terminal cleavage/methylation domain-containing protein